MRADGPTVTHAASASQLAGGLAEQYRLGATSLQNEGQLSASALMLCCGTDALAGLHAGRESYSGAASDFIAFVEEYMPVFARVVEGHVDHTYVDASPANRAARARLVWAMPRQQPVGSCAEVLYRGYRCGLVHQGILSPGVSVVDKPGNTIFVFEVDPLNGEVAYSMKLNARPFHDEFTRAVSRYMADLDGNDSLAGRFWTRWKFITGPQWALVAP